jgi:hypothetical protein
MFNTTSADAARSTRRRRADQTFLHPRYGNLTFRGQAWLGHNDTPYGSFTDTTGQQVNLPLEQVSLDLLRHIFPIFDNPAPAPSATTKEN